MLLLFAPQLNERQEATPFANSSERDAVIVLSRDLLLVQVQRSEGVFFIATEVAVSPVFVPEIVDNLVCSRRRLETAVSDKPRTTQRCKVGSQISQFLLTRDERKVQRERAVAGFPGCFGAADTPHVVPVTARQVSPAVFQRR